MDLHELAAEDRHEELKEALSRNKDNIDSYQLSKAFHKVINRHGLKGTPLHFAIIHNSINCVKVLLDCGADVSRCVIQCERGEQEIPSADALFLAKEMGNSGIIKMIAERFPDRGAVQGEKLSKAALLLFTFFLGGLGAHKFYTRRNWQGFFYLIFCWTGIPGLIALVEFVIYAFTGSEKLQQRYEASGAGVVIAIAAGAVGFIILVGILAAIIMPQLMKHESGAYQSRIRAELLSLKDLEDNYFLLYNEYSTSLEDLRYMSIIDGVTVEVVSVDDDCFEARGRHIDSGEYLYVDCEGLKESSQPTGFMPPVH